MLELAKLIHSQQENDEDIVITDRHITLDRTMHLYGEMTFKNCDFVIAPHSGSQFILEEDASVTFENCRFVGTLTKSENGYVISDAEYSALTFIKCRFENADSFIRSDGAVNLHGCEISYSGNVASGDEAHRLVSRIPRYTPYAAIGAALSCSFAVKNPTGSLLFEFIRADGEDVELTDCTFEIITLKNDFYLFDADNKSSLDGCTFKNCRTTRDDLQLAVTGGNSAKSGSRTISATVAPDLTRSSISKAWRTRASSERRECFEKRRTHPHARGSIMGYV